MLVFVTSLWVTEATPYFVTALLIPVLVVLMDIMENSSGDDKDRKKAAKVVLSHMVDHTTILIMGGYAISSAFSRRVHAPPSWSFPLFVLRDFLCQISHPGFFVSRVLFVQTLLVVMVVVVV